MPTKLVIVESPTKARTIEKYLGTPYHVISCNGHIRDLPKKERAIDTTRGFQPHYIIPEEKRQLVAGLKKQAADAEEIFLASDYDREGEAIAWHLTQALELPPTKVRRITFHEITPKAITRALQQPRAIDQDLVEAQQARRVLDRLVGYDISPILWKKIKVGLSAGRVQSIAVKLLADREKEIQQFVPQTSFKMTAQLLLPHGATLDAHLPQPLADREAAHQLLNQCLQATFTVHQIQVQERKRAPLPPFTTSTLQQEANNKLGYPVKRTMLLAQRLYEEGHITYMRTDSFHLAQDALAQARKTIIDTFGAAYHTTRTYQTRSATAQEAHEAIRPTDLSQQEVSSDASLQRVYTLIRQRVLASQMAEALIEKTTAQIHLSTLPAHPLVAQGERLRFPGFLAVYQDAQKASPHKALPALQEGEPLTLDRMQATQHYTKPPARYTEASLVKKLEELGIGRPSTYAPTISTIQQRDYVVKDSREGQERTYQRLTLHQGKICEEVGTEMAGAQKNKLFITDTGLIVTAWLESHIPQVTHYDFTAQVEAQLDAIAHKKQRWQAMLQAFYTTFSPQVTQASDSDEGAAATVRMLGKDPASGRPVLARLSRRYGPLVQLGGMDEEVKPLFASLPPGKLLSTITLAEALQLFKLPREVGTFEEGPITAHRGPYGPYLKHQGQYYSLGKDHDPHTIAAPAAIQLIQDKREAQAKSLLKRFPSHPDIQVRQGRWGPYIKTPDKNVKIPASQDPQQLTVEACLELLAQAPQRKRRRPARR